MALICLTRWQQFPNMYIVFYNTPPPPKNTLYWMAVNWCFSGKGDTVVSILIDLNDFWTYENREYLVPESSEESDI